MTAYAMNPIRIVTDNLQGFAQSLHDERIKLQDRLAEIDRQFVVIGKLAVAVGIDIGTTEQRRADLNPKVKPTDSELLSPGRVRGRVKWFNDAKGYGFIAVPGDPLVSDDVMVHFSAILMDGYKSLTEGQRVEFDLARNDAGHASAKNVVVLA